MDERQLGQNYDPEDETCGLPLVQIHPVLINWIFKNAHFTIQRSSYMLTMEYLGKMHLYILKENMIPLKPKVDVFSCFTKRNTF